MAQTPQQPPAPPDAPKPEAPARPVYAFAGKPLNVDFKCTDDDIMAFGLTCTEDEPCEVYLELVALESVGGLCRRARRQLLCERLRVCSRRSQPAGMPGR